MAHMYADNTIHRDIKPANILITGRKIMIGDLGFSRNINDQTYSTKVLTRDYASPQIMLGRKFT